MLRRSLLQVAQIDALLQPPPGVLDSSEQDSPASGQTVVLGPPLSK
jgi:hypothetical protein